MAYQGMTGKLKYYGQLIKGTSYICDKREFIKGSKNSYMNPSLSANQAGLSPKVK